MSAKKKGWFDMTDEELATWLRAVSRAIRNADKAMPAGMKLGKDFHTFAYRLSAAAFRLEGLDRKDVA